MTTVDKHGCPCGLLAFAEDHPTKASHLPTGSVVATDDDAYLKRSLVVGQHRWESPDGFESDDYIDMLIASGDAKVLRVGTTEDDQ